MTDYCKHGVKMQTTCRKCGRLMVVEVPDFAARKDEFTNSIDLLEQTVRRMTDELARERAVPPPPPLAAVPEENEPPSSEHPEPDPPAPERYPWQRR